MRVFSVDTGRLPQETFELIEQLRERYPGLAARAARARRRRSVQRLVDRHGPNLFYHSVEQRLLCCNVRKVQPLTRHLHGLDAWITGLRRDQWASRAEHPQGRDRPRPRRDREAQPARRVDGGRGLGLRPRARRARTTRSTTQGYTSIGCAPCTRAIAAGRAGARRPLVVGDERAEGVRHPLRDRDRRLRARAARDPRRGGDHRQHAAADGARSARSRSPRRRPCSRRSQRRGVPRALAALVAAVDEGALATTRRGALERLLELGLQAGRIRALYGPGGEQAALRLYRRLPRGAELGASARAVGEALGALEGRPLEAISLDAVGPGAYSSSLAADGAEAVVRLDRQGARSSVSVGCPRSATTWPASTSRAARASSSAAARSRTRRRAACSSAARASRSSRREVDAELARLPVEWLRRPLRELRPRRPFLVVAATSDREVNRAVFADAEARGLLCNVADEPELCSFILPAVHRVGPIAVAVSTGGASPALAQRLRAEIAAARAARSTPSSPRELRDAAPLGEGEPRDLRGAARLLRSGSSRTALE